MVNIEEEYAMANDRVLSEYHKIKGSLSAKDIIICEYLGAFTQDVLIDIVSSIEETFDRKEKTTAIEKRLTYLIIECIQNIIFHSDKFPKIDQISYVIVTKDDNSYTISSSNSLERKNISKLEKKLNSFLSLKSEILSELFLQKIRNPQINENNHGGLGLITMANKSGKGFKYRTSKVLENYSLFHIQLKLHYKKQHMENINHTATKDSPEIIFDNTTKTLQILGNSFPEDCEKIYSPIKLFLDKYDIKKNKLLNFDFHFNLINSTSTVYLAQIISKSAGLNKQGLPVNIKWRYYEYDEEMLDLGEKLSSISNLPIEYISIKEDD